jgi:hypothetical protein
MGGCGAVGCRETGMPKIKALLKNKTWAAENFTFCDFSR